MSRVTINPGSIFGAGTDYYVLVDASFVESTDGSRSGNDAITDTAQFTFSTNTPPALVSTSPIDDATGTIGSTYLSITADINIYANTGNIYLHKTVGNTLVETFDITTVSIVNDTITFTPASPFEAGVEYYVLMDAGAVRDSDLFAFPGISSTTAFSFTADTAPLLSSFTPILNATDTAKSTTVTLNFDQDVQAGTGDIKIYEVGGTLHQTIDITTVSFSNNTVQFDATNLDPSTSYYITIDNQAIYDTDAGFWFIGITANNVIKFTTGALPTLVLQTTTPAHRTANIILTASNSVGAGTGNLYFYKADGTLLDTIDVISAYNAGTGEISINPSVDLDPSTSYYVLYDANIVQHNGFYNTAESNTATHTFTSGAVPYYTAVSPTHNTVHSNTTLFVQFTFNENVAFNTGVIVLYKGDGSTVQSTSAGGSDVTIVNNLVSTTFTIPVNGGGESYYILADDDLVRATSSAMSWGGITSVSELNYTTTAQPVIVSTVPSDDTVELDPDTDISMTFNTPVVVNNSSANVYLYKEGVLDSTYAITTVTGLGTTALALDINVLDTINPGIEYSIQIDSDALKASSSSFEYAGISDNTTWNFTTENQPVLTSTSPSDNGVDVVKNPTISLTFDQNVIAGTGDITLFKADGTLHQTYPIATVSIVNNVVTFNASNLDPNTGYYINIDSGALTDTDAGFDYTGFSDTTTFNFTTANMPSVSSSAFHGSAEPWLIDDYTIKVTYDQSISTNAGNVVLYDGSGVVHQTFNVTTLSITSGNILEVPISNVLQETDYYLLIDDNAVQSSASGFNSDAVTDVNLIRFTTDRYSFASTITHGVGDVSITFNGGVGYIDWEGDGLGYDIYGYTGTFTHTFASSGTLSVIGHDNSSQTHFTNIQINSTVVTDVEIFDMSGITNMDQMFMNCTALTTITGLSTSNVTNMKNAFNNCTALVTMPSIDTSSVIDGYPVTGFVQTWSGCSSLTAFPLIDTSNVTYLGSTWSGCSSLTAFPSIDTSNVTYLAGAWSGCSSLTAFPLIDTSNVTYLRSTWSGCSSLTAFPSIDTSNVTHLDEAWQFCSSLTAFPSIDTSNVTDFSEIWEGCSSLTAFPLIDTDAGSQFVNTWKDCTSLVCITNVNTTHSTSTWALFDGCTALVYPDAYDITLIHQAYYDPVTQMYVYGANWVNPNPCP